MSVIAPDVIDVQSDQRVIHKALEKFQDQINVKLTNTGTWIIHAVFQAGTSRKINHHARQGLVQWYISVTITINALFVPQRLGKCLPQGNTDIFHRVVGIDVQIPLGLDLKVDETVTGTWSSM